MSRVAFVAVQHNELRRRIQAEDPDLDDETLADTLEGLTDLHEIVAAIIRAALNDEALVVGLKSRLDEMHTRLARLQDRASKRRQIARDVMVETEIKKITAPDFTLSVRPGSPALVVVNEREIPDAFWEPREPRLNRHALIAELKQGVAVAGVELSNPEPVLSVRTK
jgi:Gp157 protein